MHRQSKSENSNKCVVACSVKFIIIFRKSVLNHRRHLSGKGQEEEEQLLCLQTGDDEEHWAAVSAEKKICLCPSLSGTKKQHGAQQLLKLAAGKGCRVLKIHWLNLGAGEKFCLPLCPPPHMWKEIQGREGQWCSLAPISRLEIILCIPKICYPASHSSFAIGAEQLIWNSIESH